MMRLARLEIGTLPGIEPGFVLDDISPGVNLVTGPNGVGKSSLIRALHYLVGGPRGDDPPALSLTAVFESGRDRWTVRRTGREIVWERNGGTAARPSLPERDQLYCYWLSMEELLEADQRDERLEAELRRALSGGYDLEAVRREAPFDRRPRAGLAEARRLREAEEGLREVERTYEVIRREEARIPAVEARLVRARDAKARMERLERAIALLDARVERRGIEAGFEEFPANMALLRGDELGRLETLDGRRDAVRREIEAQIRMAEAALLRLEETNFKERRPERVELEARGRELETARRRSERREEERRRLDAAATTEREALGGLGGSEAPARLDPASVSEAESLAVELQSAELRRRELEDRIEEICAAPEEGEVERGFRGAEALRAWLSAEATAPRRFRAAILVGGAGGLAAALAALAAKLWVALIGGAFAVGAAAWAWLSLRGGGADAVRRFEESGLEPPAAWRRETVEARLRELENQGAELRERRVRLRLAEDLRSRLDRTEEELRALLRRRISLAEKLGFDPALTAGALDRFVRLVRDYEQARRDRETAAATIGRLNDEIEALTGGVADLLERWRALGAGRSLDALEAGLAELRDRLDRAGAAERDKLEADRERERLERVLADLDEEEERLFREAGLDSGRRSELARCLEELDDWAGRREQLREARAREAGRREALGEDDPLLPVAEAGDRGKLEGERSRAAEEASELEGLREELAGIRADVSAAGRDRQLERALAEVDAARAALEDRYREAVLADAASTLLEGVEEEYRSEHEPEVLRDARERFQRFTHHAFDLVLDERRGFMAVDLSGQARRSLSELSSATRMQLLLAMRLAWTRRLEQGGLPLPLFLDEALTTSDEHRFARVAESLEALAREERRQVFYLSARRHEVALWERAAGTRPHHIDLARVRFGRADAEAEDFALPEAEALPDPEGWEPERYAAALGVPPIDPQRPEGTIHVFHLLRDDLRLLHRLLEIWRTFTLGELEGLLQSSAASVAIPEASVRGELEARCGVARAWVAAWRHGRGGPVDRIALEASGAVSEVFIKRVAELAGSIGGDGAALIEAMRGGEVAHFRHHNIDELEQWLEAEGYLDRREPLTPEDRRRRVLTEAAAWAPPEAVLPVVRWLEAGLREAGAQG